MARKDISDKQVILAYLKSKEHGINMQPHEILSQILNQPEKVCYRAMERACARGYIDYGTSIRSGWVTDEGIALIKG